VILSVRTSTPGARNDMSTLLQDVRFAIRMLWHVPAFTLAAVSTLALGIGATTAIFSAANAALLRPLPYPNAQDLRTVRTTFTDGNVTSGLVAPVELTRLNDRTLPIERAAVSRKFDVTLLLADNTPRAVIAHGVSEGFFELFGLPNTLGRGFAAEHYQPKGPSAVVISHRLWREVFNSDPAIVGKTVRLAEGAPTIVGVAARDLDVPQGTDIWFNMQVEPEDVAHSFDGYLRVRRSTSAEQLRSTLDVVAQGLGRDYPGPETNRAFIVQPVIDAMVGDLKPTLVIVLSATGLLLLLACVNVTNLLLARGASRVREMAARAALGASRGRLVRQLLTESAVLAATGAIAGLLLAFVGVRVLLTYGASKLPRLEAVPFDTSVFLFVLATLMASALVVGLAPAFQLARSGLETLLNEGGRSVRGSRSTQRTLRVLIVGEIVVAITLVAGAGWVMRSFSNLQAIDPGFVDRGRLVVDLTLPFERYRDFGQFSTWTRTLFANLERIEGVGAVGSSSGFPTRPDNDATPLVQIEGSPNPPVVARRRTVSPGFFDAMGIRMRQGRSFNDDDRATSAPVAIVNQSFAQRYVSGMDPTRTQISFGFPTINPRTRRAVIGVVSDVKYASLQGDPEPAFYVVQDQFPTLRMSVAIATTLADPRAATETIRSAINKADPLLAFEIEPVEALMASTLSRQKLGMTLMLVFGVMAVTLAAIGIYGVIAYASAERSREFATRMALGASSSNVFWLLAGQARVLALVGGVLGLGAAYTAGRLASSWLYEVRASDPMILAGALAIVLAVTVCATLIPARRVSRTDPAQALRGD
jgi:putative ABC transport system permease protein